MLYPMNDKGILDSTWGGNLADMVRFCQEMKVIETEKLMEQIPAKTAILVDGLKSIQKKYPDKIFNIRGMGLYQGFTMKSPELLNKLIEYAQDVEKLLLLEAGTESIRLRPPMDVTIEEIKQMLETLDKCLAATNS